MAAGGVESSGGTGMARSLLLFLVLTLMPSAVFAHATPVSMQPHSGVRLSDPPAEISITFSEHLEEGSSRIRVTDRSGNRMERGEAHVSDDGRTMHVPLESGEGVFTVAWSVVSKDDGHFTRGSFAYSVRSDVPLPEMNEEVVQIATSQEAGLMFVEFLGNSLLWGLLAVFLLSRDERVRKPFVFLSVIAALCGMTGAGGQLILKAHQLAGLHDVGLFEAFGLYTRTVAGYATIVRGCALAFGGIAAGLWAYRSARTTALTLSIPLLIFAFFRAIVSHATANPFYPLVSIAVNFVHVIEKDLWLGALLVVCVLLGSRIRDHVVPELLPRVFTLLSINLAVLAGTAAYIVWLHLQDLSNLTGSQWGAAFIPLLVSAMFLVVLQIYHVCMIRVRPNVVRRSLAFTIGAQTAAAALVVFFTSVVIITSPPSHTPRVEFTAVDQGSTVALSHDPYEDGMVLLTVSDATREPTVMIGARDGGLRVALEKRFAGGYVFPAALIPASTTQLSIVAPRERGYDIQASFNLSAADFVAKNAHGRSMDRFTVMMIAIALTGIALSFVLRRLSMQHEPRADLKAAGSKVLIGMTVMSVVILICIAFTQRSFNNAFAARCVADGNMWHIMQPAKAGVPVSGEAREGCMWGMGRYAYQFADPREYEYLGSLGPAAVTMETLPRRIVANVPTDLTFRLTNADGTPATLLIDMEKYVHVVIVSKDETVFAHLHPDDARPLKQYEIETSTYSVEYTFPKAGEYLVSLDYAHGTQLESKQFTVDVVGSPAQSTNIRTYPSPGRFGDYEVSMNASGASAGEVTTLKFNVEKGGEPVTTMQPYLSAVSHISVVKNDLSAFVHTHGEIHPAGQPYPPITVRDGKIIHAMSAMTAPASFGPSFEAHVIFPAAGRYTIWAQIRIDGRVIPTSFTLDVER